MAINKSSDMCNFSSLMNSVIAVFLLFHCASVFSDYRSYEIGSIESILRDGSAKQIMQQIENIFLSDEYFRDTNIIAQLTNLLNEPYDFSGIEKYLLADEISRAAPRKKIVLDDNEDKTKLEAAGLAWTLKGFSLFAIVKLEEPLKAKALLSSYLNSSNIVDRSLGLSVKELLQFQPGISINP